MAGERLGDELKCIRREDIQAAVAQVVGQGLLRFPTSLAASMNLETHFLDTVREQLPALSYASDDIADALRQGDQGWTDEQIGLLASGADMLVVVLHALITQASPE